MYIEEYQLKKDHNIVIQDEMFQRLDDKTKSMFEPRTYPWPNLNEDETYDPITNVITREEYDEESRRYIYHRREWNEAQRLSFKDKIELAKEAGSAIFQDKIGECRGEMKELEKDLDTCVAWMQDQPVGGIEELLAQSSVEDAKKRIRKKKQEIAKWMRLELAASGRKDLKSELAIDRAKEYPIEELHSFERMRKTGSRSFALCPFHQETTPSFVIYHHNNSYYCFGCGKGGDSISFIQDLHECDFVEAVKHITK